MLLVKKDKDISDWVALDDLVKGRVKVLDTTVNQQHGLSRWDAFRCDKVELFGNAGIERAGHIPGENPSGKIIDDRVQICPTATLENKGLFEIAGELGLKR